MAFRGTTPAFLISGASLKLAVAGWGELREAVLMRCWVVHGTRSSSRWSPVMDDLNKGEITTEVEGMGYTKGDT